MTSATEQTRPADQARGVSRGRRRYRSKPVIGMLATVLALWLGLTAPAVSPVAPVTPTQQASPAVGAPVVDQAVDQPIVVDHGRGGRGRR